MSAVGVPLAPTSSVPPVTTAVTPKKTVDEVQEDAANTMTRYKDILVKRYDEYKSQGKKTPAAVKAEIKTLQADAAAARKVLSSDNDLIKDDSRIKDMYDAALNKAGSTGNPSSAALLMPSMRREVKEFVSDILADPLRDLTVGGTKPLTPAEKLGLVLDLSAKNPEYAAAIAVYLAGDKDVIGADDAKTPLDDFHVQRAALFVGDALKILGIKMIKPDLKTEAILIETPKFKASWQKTPLHEAFASIIIRCIERTLFQTGLYKAKGHKNKTFAGLFAADFFTQLTTIRKRHYAVWSRMARL